MSNLQPHWPMTRAENDKWGKHMADMIWPDKDKFIKNAQCCVIVDSAAKEVRAIFAFHEWDEDAGVIQMSGASKGRWSTRGIFRALYGYVFDQLGCQLVMNRNDPENTRLIDMLTRLGYQKYIIPRLRGRNKCDVVMTLTSEDWSKHPINKEFSHGNI